MAQRCKICIHPQRADIEQQILEGVPSRAIALQWNGFAHTTVSRHKQHMDTTLHLVQEGVRTSEVVDKVVTSTLSRTEQFHARFTELRDKVDVLLKQAEEDKNVGQQIAGIREARGLLDLESKVVLQILGMRNDEDNDVKVQYEIMGEAVPVVNG